MFTVLLCKRQILNFSDVYKSSSFYNLIDKSFPLDCVFPNMSADIK